MAEQTTSSIVIDAAPADVMAVIADFPAYPEWAEQVKTVTVLSEDGDGWAYLVLIARTSHNRHAVTVVRTGISMNIAPRGYIVPRADGRILVGATVEDAGFDKSVTEAGIDFLLEHALEIAPSLVNLSIAEKWAGLRPASADGLPVWEWRSVRKR